MVISLFILITVTFISSWLTIDDRFLMLLVIPGDTISKLFRSISIDITHFLLMCMYAEKQLSLRNKISIIFNAYVSPYGISLQRSKLFQGSVIRRYTSNQSVIINTWCFWRIRQTNMCDTMQNTFVQKPKYQNLISKIHNMKTLLCNKYNQDNAILYVSNYLKYT